MEIEIIDAEFIFFSLSAIALVVGVFSLVIWWIALALKMKEIDNCFESPDFPLRSYVGIWPWGISKCLSYGVFLLFRDSNYVKRKHPLACKNIVVENIPKKIRFIVAFPIFTVMPCAIIIWIGGTFLYIKDWIM
ncbi:hypothetical protein [Vreelandella songnenensis]|uniref:hypothetical protein n=1 Tax=Vreelandella songnenensis TaxID=1176243 RepID=UPI0011B20543|nr:hypothetical protein [Halomonas songnenensis]